MSILAASTDNLGAVSLVFMFVWLGSGALAGWLASKKGYVENWGIASGLALPVVGVIAWALIPKKVFVREQAPGSTAGPVATPAGIARTAAEKAAAESNDS